MRGTMYLKEVKRKTLQGKLQRQTIISKSNEGYQDLCRPISTYLNSYLPPRLR